MCLRIDFDISPHWFGRTQCSLLEKSLLYIALLKPRFRNRRSRIAPAEYCNAHSRPMQCRREPPPNGLFSSWCNSRWSFGWPLLRRLEHTHLERIRTPFVRSKMAQSERLLRKFLRSRCVRMLRAIYARFVSAGSVAYKRNLHTSMRLSMARLLAYTISIGSHTTHPSVSNPRAPLSCVLYLSGAKDSRYSFVRIRQFKCGARLARGIHFADLLMGTKSIGDWKRRCWAADDRTILVMSIPDWFKS